MDTSAHKKHHGLKNHGATCYLNSVLQVLFMTKDFREAVQRLTNGNPDFIDHQLKDVFDDLLERTADTFKILESLHIDRVYEQRDAAEHLEKLLRRTSPEAAKTFHGELTSSISCSVCGAGTSSDGQFWHLPLPLVDSCNRDYSVVGGLKEFFQTSHLNGENQMYCDRCDTKVDAKRETIVKLHPDVLILLLKRFDFSYQYMSFVKINCDVDVPYTVEIPENQKYELYALVNHFGDLRSGHYTAAIKDQDEDRWYEFNDTTVIPYDKQPFLDNEKSIKSSWPYLLFYRKKETAAEEGKDLLHGGSAASTCESHNESHVADTDRMTQEQSEVSVDTEDDVLSNGTSSEHTLKPHSPEIRVEPVEPALSDGSPHGHAGEQESNKDNNDKDDQKRHAKVQTEHRSLLPNVTQLEGNNSENPELNKMKAGISHDFTSVSERSDVHTSNALSKETHDKLNEPLSRCAGHQHNKESSHVENSHEYQCGNQNDSLKPGDAANVGEEGRMKADINKDKMEESTDSEKVIPPKRLLNMYDLCYSQHMMDHRQKNFPENDQKHEKGKLEKREEGWVDIRGSDHDAGQNKSGQRDDVTHEMQSKESVEKHNEMRDNKEKTDSSYAQPGSQAREKIPFSQVSENDENTEISKQAASREKQGVSGGGQSSKQPGDVGTIAVSGGERSKTKETSHVSKLIEPSLLTHEKCTTKGVSDKQMEATGIKYTLKKRSLKQNKHLGYSGHLRPAPRVRKTLNIKKYLGVFLSPKSRRTQIRIQRQMKRKSTPV